MAFFNQSFQAPITPSGGGAINTGAAPSSASSGDWGASLVQSNGAPQGGVYSQQSFGGNTPNGSFDYGSQPINMSNLPAPPSSPMGPFPSSTPTGGGGAGAQAPQGTGQFGSPGWTPGVLENLGQYTTQYGAYNPGQFTNQSTANTLANALGGNAYKIETNTGPYKIPDQWQVNLGGNAQLNAGLLADRYAKYDRATADAMTQAELAQLNGGGGGNGLGQFLGGTGNQSPGTPPPQQFWSGGAPGGGNSPSPIPQQNPLVPGTYGPAQVQGPQMQLSQGGLGRYGNFAAANRFAPQQQLMNLLFGGGNFQPGQFSARSRPPAFNQGLMGSLMGMPSLLSRMNQVSGFGGNGGWGNLGAVASGFRMPTQGQFQMPFGNRGYDPASDYFSNHLSGLF